MATITAAPKRSSRLSPSFHESTAASAIDTPLRKLSTQFARVAFPEDNQLLWNTGRGSCGRGCEVLTPVLSFSLSSSSFSQPMRAKRAQGLEIRSASAPGVATSDQTAQEQWIGSSCRVVVGGSHHPVSVVRGPWRISNAGSLAGFPFLRDRTRISIRL